MSKTPETTSKSTSKATIKLPTAPKASGEPLLTTSEPHSKTLSKGQIFGIMEESSSATQLEELVRKVQELSARLDDKTEARKYAEAQAKKAGSTGELPIVVRSFLLSMPR